MITAQLNEGASSNLKELVPTIGVGDFQVEKISYLEGNVWINSAKTQDFPVYQKKCGVFILADIKFVKVASRPASKRW